MFIAALFKIVKIWKQPKCPVDEWIKKVWYLYTMEYYSAIRKKEILPFATACTELETFMLSAMSQAEEDKALIHLRAERLSPSANIFLFPRPHPSAPATTAVLSVSVSSTVLLELT